MYVAQLKYVSYSLKRVWLGKIVCIQEKGLAHLHIYLLHPSTLGPQLRNMFLHTVYSLKTGE